MNVGLKGSLGSKLRAGVGLVLGVLMIAGASAVASMFEIPEDTALRIRLDDTLTSVDSQVGDPFSASVVDTGEYRNARIIENLIERRNLGTGEGDVHLHAGIERPNFVEGHPADFAFAVGRTTDVGIVHENQFSVGGRADIDFDVIRTHTHRLQ